MNSIAYNAQLDQIVLSVRGCNEIWFLDHSTTTKEAAGHTGGKHGKGGDLIYRWGNPAAYRRGTTRDKQLVQQHDAQWIPDGYPGAGHITIFNNGYDRGWSSVEEIVPPVDASGRYILEAGKAYGPEKPVWHYEAKNRTDFFSSEISGAHRLPNGNTLICAGVDRQPVRSHARRRNRLAIREPDGARRHPRPGRSARQRPSAAICGTPCSKSIATRPTIPAWPDAI